MAVCPLELLLSPSRGALWSPRLCVGVWFTTVAGGAPVPLLVGRGPVVDSLVRLLCHGPPSSTVHLAVVGPESVGKTAVLMEVCRRLGGDKVCVELCCAA